MSGNASEPHTNARPICRKVALAQWERSFYRRQCNARFPGDGDEKGSRFNADAAPATVTGERIRDKATDGAPFGNPLGRQRIHVDPASQETCLALPFSGTGGVHRNRAGLGQ